MVLASTNAEAASVLENTLRGFRDENKISTKGSLALVIQLTRLFRDRSLPLNPEDFITERGGQVKQIGGSFLKKVLSDHGITRTLASEGGRTSRGTLEIMANYVNLVNALYREFGYVDLAAAERFWATCINEYFSHKPFKLVSDPSMTVGAAVGDLFKQARKREKENPGLTYAGSVLQYLVAAKLASVLPEGSFDIHGASVADAPTGRSGDFVLGNAVIHCTTAPGAPLIEKVAGNLKSGLTPYIITVPERLETAKNLVDDAGLGGRVEIWDIEQFLSSNVGERSQFDESRRKDVISQIVDKYNEAVDANESDPGMRISFLACT